MKRKRSVLEDIKAFCAFLLAQEPWKLLSVASNDDYSIVEIECEDIESMQKIAEMFNFRQKDMAMTLRMRANLQGSYSLQLDFRE